MVPETVTFKLVSKITKTYHPIAYSKNGHSLEKRRKK
jgi:hypothetical protein